MKDDADRLEWMRSTLAQPPYHDFLRPEVVGLDLAAGELTVRLPYRPEFRRLPDNDAIHGGILSALIDLCGNNVVVAKLGHFVPTINMRIDYLSMASGGSDLIAKARILRAGRSIAVADVEVTDDKGRLVAVGRCTLGTQAK